MQFIDLKKQQKHIEKSLNKRIKAVLSHGKYIMGPEIFKLEEKLSEFVGLKHCITCSSGTDALLIPLLARGIAKGDAVITSPFTYVATAEVISLLGATPVFCDIYESTYNLDPSKIDQAVNHALSLDLKPKAIIPVDLFGLPARYRIIEEKAKEHNLFIIEDAAQGFGGNIRGKRSGSFGDVAATSFFPAKPLGCYGDGGAIFTDDDDLAEKMRSIRIHGQGKDKYDNIRIGINGRLDTIQAAVLLEKLNIFENELKLRDDIAKYYKNNISNNFLKPHIPDGYFSSWAQFSLVPKIRINRKTIIQELSKKEIPIMTYYSKSLHLQEAFKPCGYKAGDFLTSETISNTIFSIPMHPYLDIDDQNYIIEALNELSDNIDQFSTKKNNDD